jgi:cytochrome o ubiquinol oxidase operon protein cyoD
MDTHTYFEDIGAWPRGARVARAYAAGFVLSVALTLAAYVLAVHAQLSGEPLVASLVALALLQFVVQVVCFLHLGKGEGSRERLIVLGAGVVVVSILVSGSLWIMFTLNGRMMPSTAQMEQYMNNQEGI